MMRRLLPGSGLAGAALLLALTQVAVSAPAGAETHDDGDPLTGNPLGERLYLVTMSTPGTAAHEGPGSTTDYRTKLLHAQDDTLARVGASEPAYRWTSALSGFAVQLDSTQAATVAALPEVEMVEAEDTLDLAGARSAAGSVPSSAPHGEGGRGTVIGIVDSGINPDNPVFAATPALGRPSVSFRGACVRGDNWTAQNCNDKVVGARYFVKGFGADRLRSGAPVSPRDDDGHGTQVASIAAGNADVTALADGDNLGDFSGAAPDARIAAYKACWNAPDPDDDGCSTADVVTAIDAAVRDRVDVLNLSMTGQPGLDTVDLALLGAAEQDVSVLMAAGNGQDQISSAPPWTMVVGASTGPDRRGELRLSDGTAFEGVMAARGTQKPSGLVPGAKIPAPGRSSAQARLCIPGSLDASRAAGKIVLCERGRVARVDKSAAVKLADGVAMVLVNAARRPLSADFHSVPTLHVSASEGDRLRRELRAPGHVTGRLVRVPDLKSHPRVLPWSARGRPDNGVVEPSLVSPGFGLLAATAGAGDSSSWELLSGTSASTATVSGIAAKVRARHPRWDASRVRSALMTSSTGAGGVTPLAQGSGVASPDHAMRPGLSFDLDPAAYRRMLERDEDASVLNLPSVMARQPDHPIVITRKVTNTGSRHMYYSSSARGFETHQVSVTPAALRIAPGETRRFKIRIAPRPGTRPEVDSGRVAWHGANGLRVRIPVVLPR